MKAALIFTGNNGSQNANSGNTAFMIRELNLLGYVVDIHRLNLNNPNDFLINLNKLMQNYPLCIIIGGLSINYNPNVKEVISKSLNLNLEPHQQSVQKLQQIYSKKGQQPTGEDIRYITIPHGAWPITDDNYAIPGFVLENGGRSLIVLPDNDDVYIDMYVKTIFPYLARMKKVNVANKLINIFGLSNAQAQNILKAEIMAPEALVSVFGKSTGAKYVNVSALNNGSTPAQAGVIRLTHAIKNKLGSLISDEDIQMLPANIVKVVKEYELTLSIAESITDGSIEKNLKSIPNGESVIETSVNSLINDVKHKEMNVPKDILRDFPDASEHMAMCMSAGILENGTADIALSVSGGMISDNRGGFNSTGFVSLATEQGVIVKKVDLIGLSMAESQIIAILTISALNMLYVFLKGLPNSVHDLYELKTLRQKDLDKTIENIRKKEELILQAEMEEVTASNQQLMSFRGRYPERHPPVIIENQTGFTLNNQKMPDQSQYNQAVNIKNIQGQSPPKKEEFKESLSKDDDAILMEENFVPNQQFEKEGEGQPSHNLGDGFKKPESQGKNTDIKDGAIKMDENNYNPYNPNPEQNQNWNEQQDGQKQQGGQFGQDQGGQFPQNQGQGQSQNPWGQQSQGGQFGQDQGGQFPQGQQPQSGQQDPWGQQPQSGQFNQGQGQQEPWGQQPQSGQFGQGQSGQFLQNQGQGQQPQSGQFDQGQGQQDPWGQQPQNQGQGQQPQSGQQEPWGQQPQGGQFPQGQGQQQDPWGQQPQGGQFPQGQEQQQDPWGQQPQSGQFNQGQDKQFPQGQQDSWGQQPQGGQFNQGQGGQYSQNQGQQEPWGQQIGTQNQNNKSNQKKKILNDNKDKSNENLSLLQEMRMIFLPHKNDSAGKKVGKILLILGIIAIAIGVGYFINVLLGDTYNGTIMPPTNPLALYEEGVDENNIPETYPENYSLDFVNMYLRNPDIKGILEFEKGKIKYPVLQSESNSTYKEKNFYKEEGSVPFVDSRSNMNGDSTNTLVYGYSTNDPLFEEIKEYAKASYYNENPDFSFNNVYGDEQYTVFAAFIISENPDHNDTYSYANYVNAVEKEDFLDIIYDAKMRSTIVTDVDVDVTDDLLFLSVDLDDFDGARLMVAAKKNEESSTESLASSSAKENEAPLYPDEWYSIYGGEKPNIEPRPSERLPLEMANLSWMLEEMEKEASKSDISSESSIKEESKKPASEESKKPVSEESKKPASEESKSSSSESNSQESSLIEVSKEESKKDNSEISISSESSQENNSTPPPVSGKTISVIYNGSKMDGDAIDIVSRVVAAEMSDFYPTEALKAQAIATYTFIIYNNNKGVSPEVPMREPSNKIISAVTEVSGKLLTYNGSVAFTPYYAISAGKTNPSQEIWTEARPYLITVDSSACKQSPYYEQTRTFTESEVISRIEEKMGFTPEGDPSTWFRVDTFTQGGYNWNMTVGGRNTTASGRKITGGYLRASVFSLRSSAFNVSYQNGSFTFTTYGYGHGVGMSQVGAYHYVNSNGYNYIDVLNHYYPGITIS